MSTPPSSSSSIGWFTALTLSLLIAACLMLIGFSGYVKYQLDRAEAVLAAPEAALPTDQDALVRLRRALGYSGFTAAAQTFVATHDHTAVNDMKVSLKTAQDILSQLPEKTPAEARRDLQSILDIFAATAQKADQAANDASVGFVQSDMNPLYAALPVLDQRAESAMATGRFAAQSNVKLWATLLTLIAWMSLVVAAACASGIYLSLRGRHAAPLRALAQSIQNMARGDMRTPIWGMERQDIVGDLARSADLARYHFSQLPDMSLLSEQGPLRVRFEGKARSLFEAMMQGITRDSESIRAQASSLADAINQQKEAVNVVSNRIVAAVGTMDQEQQARDQQVQQLLGSVMGSAQSLRGAQAATEAHLGHLIAYLEERAKGMAEVTQIAGRQVAQTLQSLSLTEHNLRGSAEQNQETVRKLAESTDELGERLFGAVSLLRAGGKVLTETAENTQTRLNEAISLLSQSEGSLRQMLVQGFEPVGLSSGVPGPAREEETKRLQAIVGGFEAAQRKLEECITQQVEAASAQIEQLTAHSKDLLTQAGVPSESLAAMIFDIGGRLEQRISDSLTRAETAMHGLDRLSEMAEQMGGAVERLTALEQSDQAAEKPDDLLMEIKSGFEVTTRSIARLREEFIGAALERPAAPEAAPTTSSETPIAWEKMLEQVRTSNDSLAHTISEQTERIETQLKDMDKKLSSPAAAVASNSNVTGMSPDEAQAQLRQQAQVLSELASALGAIDQHMQEMAAMFRQGSSNGRMAS